MYGFRISYRNWNILPCRVSQMLWMLSIFVRTNACGKNRKTSFNAWNHIPSENYGVTTKHSIAIVVRKVSANRQWILCQPDPRQRFFYFDILSKVGWKNRELALDIRSELQKHLSWLQPSDQIKRHTWCATALVFFVVREYAESWWCLHLNDKIVFLNAKLLLFLALTKHTCKTAVGRGQSSGICQCTLSRVYLTCLCVALTDITCHSGWTKNKSPWGNIFGKPVRFTLLRWSSLLLRNTFAALNGAMPSSENTRQQNPPFLRSISANHKAKASLQVFHISTCWCASKLNLTRSQIRCDTIKS